MAIPVNIEDLINKRVVESTKIEFKRLFGHDGGLKSG